MFEPRNIRVVTVKTMSKKKRPLFYTMRVRYFAADNQEKPRGLVPDS